MRTAAKTLSHAWFGSVPPLWAGAVNPLPADMPLGNYVLTLTNVAVGSRVHIASRDDKYIYVDEVVGTSEPVYSLGVFGVYAMNQLRIKVRKGTGSPTYKPFETLATAVVGAQSIYVGQIPDE